MSDNAVLHAKPPPSRPWLRFTLRLLLAFITLLCLALGLWTHRAREQRRVVQRIQQSGGHVYYDEGPMFIPVVMSRSTYDWLDKALGHDFHVRVASVIIFDCELVRDLDKLPGLMRLHVYDSALTDDDLKVLLRCHDMRELVVGKTHYSKGLDPSSKPDIGDKSLKVIARMPQLEYATLFGEGFSRTGIQALASSKSLRSLEIGSCDETVGVSDFDDIRRMGRIIRLHAWRDEEAIVNW
jgi:hypothetical protein